MTFTTVVVVIPPAVPVTVTAYAPAVVVVVVLMVRVAFCDAVPAMVTEDGTPQVAGLVAPVGAMVTAQVRLTAPVKPLEGVTVMMAVLPLVAPAVMLMLPPLESAKLAAGVTATVFVPVAEV